MTADDLAFYVGEFRRTGLRGPLNWYRASKANHELMAAFNGVALDRPALYVGGEQDVVVNWPAMRDLIGDDADVRAEPHQGRPARRLRPLDAAGATGPR